MATDKLLKSTHLLEDYVRRPAAEGDAEAINALLLACDSANGTDTAPTLEEIQRELEDAWLGDRTANSLIVETSEGQMAGFAMVFMDPEPLHQRRAFLWLDVHPAHSDLGLQDELLAWADGRAQERLEALDSPLPGVIRASCEDRLEDHIALYTAHGLQPERYFYRMRRDLRQPLPRREVPGGLTLRAYSPDLNRPVMAAFNEAFMDHWNFEPVNPEDWDIWFTGREDFRPDLTFVVMDGDEVAGFSLNGVNPEKNRRRGIEEGWIFDLGTRRPWRRQGIASALLCASMQAFKAEGLEFAALGVDTQNTSGALHLYESLGFVAVKRFIGFAREID